MYVLLSKIFRPVFAAAKFIKAKLQAFFRRVAVAGAVLGNTLEQTHDGLTPQRCCSHCTDLLTRRVIPTPEDVFSLRKLPKQSCNNDQELVVTPVKVHNPVLKP